MAGERVNILGISMNEWREMTGLKAPPVDLTHRPVVVESYEDEIEETAAVRSALRDIGVPAKEPMPPPVDPSQRAKAGLKPLATRGGSTPDSRGALSGIRAMNAKRRGANEEAELQLWAVFLEAFDVTPDEFSAFVESADEVGDEEALLAIDELEDEFVEALSYYLEGDAATKQSVSDYLAKGGKVTKLPTRKARGYMPAGMKVKGGPATQFGHQLPKKAEDIEALWSEWLEERGLSVETFETLVETIETEEDLVALEELQAMFEAEIAGQRIAGSSPAPGDKELSVPGKAPQKLQSLAHGQVKPSRKGNFSLPASMRAKMGLPKEDDMDEDDEAFECDDDGNGHPDMKHPGWAKALKKWKTIGKTGGKS